MKTNFSFSCFYGLAIFFYALLILNVSPQAVFAQVDFILPGQKARQATPEEKKEFSLSRTSSLDGFEEQIKKVPVLEIINNVGGRVYEVLGQVYSDGFPVGPDEEQVANFFGSVVKFSPDPNKAYERGFGKDKHYVRDVKFNAISIINGEMYLYFTDKAVAEKTDMQALAAQYGLRFFYYSTASGRAMFSVEPGGDLLKAYHSVSNAPNVSKVKLKVVDSKMVLF